MNQSNFSLRHQKIYWTEETTRRALNGKYCADRGLLVSEYMYVTTPAATKEACEALKVPGAGGRPLETPGSICMFSYH